jgi:hypothetical protein
MPQDSPVPNGQVVVDKMKFLQRLRGGFSRVRLLIIALGAILIAVGAYVSSLGVVREELCRDGLRWACSRLSCSQPILLDPRTGKLKTTISNPTEYSANILNATLDVNVGSEHFSIPLQAGAEGAALQKDCVASSSSISNIDLKSKSATTVEVRPMNQDCESSGDSACDASTPSTAISRNCKLTLRVRDGLGSEYPLDSEFPCSGLALRKCGKGQVDSQHAKVHTISPAQNPKEGHQDLLSPTLEQVRKDVSSHFVSEGTVVTEQDIWPEAPRSCRLDTNRRECSVRVEVTTTDVSGLRHCQAHFAVYRYVSNSWKLDDLTDAGKCMR